MSEQVQPKPPYRFTGMGILYFGIAAFVVGALLYIYAFGTVLGAVGLFLGLAGVALLIIGFVRLAGERKTRTK